MTRSKSKKQKNKKTYEPDPASLPKLPLDMVEIIANLLADKNLRRTCASLDSVCKAFKEVVDPILWKNVVFRWNNAGKGKKGEDKSKTVFESDGAQYIQFLTVIPVDKPDTRLDYEAAKFSFLTTLIAKENRLQVCIVPGNNVQQIGIYLFERYKPCSSALFTIMELVELVRRITRGLYIGAYIHPCTKPSIVADCDTDDFATMLVHAFKQLPEPGAWKFPPFLGVGLVLSRHNSLPSNHFKALFADMLALLRGACHKYCDDTSSRARIMSPMSVRADVWDACVAEAMTIGECLKVGYYLDKSLAASVYRIRTVESLTIAQVKSFTLIMERAYLSTHTRIKTHPPGGPYIIDESAESTLLKAETIQSIDPLAPVDEDQGMLQYMPMGEAFQAMRAIMIPRALGQSQIDPLDMPQ